MKYENLFSNIKMGKEILTFGDIEIEKFENFKSLFFSKDVDFEDILVSKKISSGEKKNVNTLLITYMMIIKLSQIKSVLILKKNFIANLFTINNFIIK